MGADREPVTTAEEALAFDPDEVVAGEPCTVFIRRNEDGEVHTMSDEFYGDYIWADGNFSCDCNRSLFFDNIPWAGAHACGDTAFTVWIEDENGNRLYADDDAPKIERGES